MKLLLAAALALSLAGTTCLAQSPVRVRGQITAVTAQGLTVKSRDGRDLTLVLPESATVSVTKPVRFEEIKDGDFLGATTKRDASGNEVAVELHYLPPTANAGQSAWDLAPNSKMTNAIVQAKVVQAGNHEITVQYPGGRQRILVPDGTPVVRAVPGTRADLVAGEYVFAAAQAGSDGALTVVRIQVSKDGVRPPQ